jgi:integrase
VENPWSLFAGRSIAQRRRVAVSGKVRLARLVGLDPGLHDARCHDLRRTFASTAAELGYGDATIAELLGHARRGVTERHYVRRPDAVLIEAASRTGELIDARMTGRQAHIVIWPNVHRPDRTQV